MASAPSASPPEGGTALLSCGCIGLAVLPWTIPLCVLPVTQEIASRTLPSANPRCRIVLPASAFPASAEGRACSPGHPAFIGKSCLPSQL